MRQVPGSDRYSAPLHLPRVPPPVDDIAKTIEEEAEARSEAPAPKIPKKAIQRGEDITPVREHLLKRRVMS
jgi:hypothetical protein